MLTDMMVEEEFEISEDEPWYDHQDLEHDLHLAAELGKTLLDRNRELEEGLQQMYSTNQEQLQEIEYLTKQVDLLRQMNEQHAKVYEQLDVTARELELANHKLVLDSRASQQKTTELVETIEGLQAQVSELQRQVEEMKQPSRGGCLKRDLAEQRRSSSAQSVSCLKELYDLRKYFVYDHVFAEKITSEPSELSQAEEENAALKRTVTSLQGQLRAERGKRTAAEQEVELISLENRDLEQRIAELNSCRARVRELESDVNELRQMCKSDSAFVSRVEKLVPESFLISFRESLQERETGEGGPDPAEENGVPEIDKRSLKRSSSETSLKSTSEEEIRKGHEQTCIRRSESVKQRGISLLNEVDAQYSALQVKYEELLRKCQLNDSDGHSKAVQTSWRYSRSSIALALPSPSDSLPWSQPPTPDSQQPEYKALFKEIFTCIKKTKEDISEHQREKNKPVSSSQTQ
ncbi:cerebellar degeneration-related protein 2-like [Acipenser oxyrinchus oxyrinchus]|uniref:Cerebellar degeneration-related protein 2-like n=1 Tax=Acipenser oxyrinchus oxyrinchus TaxID=40147 RepID=A0AAD8D9Y3_ACIOX|nr:cerebellar degeneration-related protein 2-like [Acipenser oxyrinchus oxyrinchus]